MKLQEEEGLRLGTRLTQAHINWKTQKMKVNLAVQVFSQSVANALEYCNLHLRLPQFQGAEATVEFIRHVDGAFDVLNSRNIFGRQSKAPLKIETYEAQESIIKNTNVFLLSLENDSGTPLHKGQRKVGFLGFVLSGRSFLSLYTSLVGFRPGAPLTYLLGYKFSQDHLELFFSAVRSLGGFNNNPTARQFKAAYRRLLMRHHVKAKVNIFFM